MKLYYWWLTAFKNYSDFSGRAGRSEYWYFFLGNVIIQFVLSLIEMSLGLQYSYGMYGPHMGLLTWLFWIAFIIPNLSIGVRRLHDSDHSGWFILTLFIPLVGPLVYLYFMLLPSDPTPNQYGMHANGVYVPIKY